MPCCCAPCSPQAAQARPKASALDHLGSAIEYTDRARRTIAQARHAIDEAAAQSPKELVGSVNGERVQLTYGSATTGRPEPLLS